MLDESVILEKIRQISFSKEHNYILSETYPNYKKAYHTNIIRLDILKELAFELKIDAIKIAKTISKGEHEGFLKAKAVLKEFKLN